MDISIAKLNIDHYRKLLRGEISAADRAIVEQMLKREEVALRRLEAERAGSRRRLAVVG